MVFTNAGKEMTALLWSESGARPIAVAIGSGSGAVGIGNGSLVAETDRNTFTGGSVDIGTVQEVAMQADWSSLEMSGTNLREFGVFNTSGADTGSAYNREGFTSLTFDGTNELQIQVTFETF